MNFLKSLVNKPATCVLCLEEASTQLPLIVHDSVSFCAECLRDYLRREIVSNAKRASPVLLAGPDKAHKAPFGVDFVRKFADDETRRVVDDVLARTVPRAHPTALADFGYSFSSDGRLQPKFHFVTQTHYDAFGDLAAPYIQQLMRERFDMRELFLPRDAADGPQTNVFLTPDALTCDALLLLIQGSGAVRAGQWARAVCLNDSLEKGSILPYLARAKKNGMGVIVFNPNLTSVDVPARVFTQADFLTAAAAPRAGVKRVPIPGSETPPAHTVSVFDELVRGAAARDLVIVAHSAGGHCTMQLLREREELMTRLRAIAFTDSVHSVSLRESKEVVDFFRRGDARDWVQSNKPLDTPIKEELYGNSAGCPCVSAGDTRHEYTSPAAIESVFAFLCDKLGRAYDGNVAPIDYSLPSTALFTSAVSVENDDDGGDAE
jgi:hypothetical protein